jgi:hypothetical protein
MKAFLTFWRSMTDLERAVLWLVLVLGTASLFFFIFLLSLIFQL